MASRRSIAVFIIAVCAMPLLFALMPFLAPIFGAVAAFTTALLAADSGNLSFNATFPWFALASVLTGLFLVFGAAIVFGERLGR